MRLRCAQCDRTGGEDCFLPAVNPERRATLGEVYSDLECPECGALAYPVVEASLPAGSSVLVVLHEHGTRRSVYVAYGRSVAGGRLDRATTRRVARALELDVGADPGSRLTAYAIPSEEVRTVRP